MAQLLLTNSEKVLFAHVPKTGGHFVHSILSMLKVPGRNPGLLKPACAKHATPNYYEEHDWAFCVVRHPATWARSYWKFHRGVKLHFKPDLYYPHLIFGSAMPDSFEAFVEHLIDNAGCVSELFEEYVKHCRTVMRLESIERDLAVVLTELGHPITEKELRHQPLQNVSRPWNADYSNDLLERFLKGEQLAIERWYPNAS